MPCVQSVGNTVEVRLSCVWGRTQITGNKSFTHLNRETARVVGPFQVCYRIPVPGGVSSARLVGLHCGQRGDTSETNVVCQLILGLYLILGLILGELAADQKWHWARGP